jgi:hypothetical protein
MSDPSCIFIYISKTDQQKGKAMKLQAKHLQAGDALRQFDGTWIAVRRVNREANLMRVWPMVGSSFTVLADARWEIRKAEMARATVEPIDSEVVRERARARFTL